MSVKAFLEMTGVQLSAAGRLTLNVTSTTQQQEEEKVVGQAPFLLGKCVYCCCTLCGCRILAPSAFNQQLSRGLKPLALASLVPLRLQALWTEQLVGSLAHQCADGNQTIQSLIM